MHELLGQKELILTIEAIAFRLSDYNLSENEEEILRSAQQKLTINYAQLMELLGRNNK
jgi:hypothetical protein